MEKFIKDTFDLTSKILQNAWVLLRSPVNPWWLVAILLPLLILIPFDAATLAQWRFSDTSHVNQVAQFISKRGDFYIFTAAAVIILFACGLALKKKNLRALAIAMLLSCATAGILSLAIRIFSGRPRPSTYVADGLYGPKFKPGKGGFMFFNYDYQSFPSGHSTTAFATAAPALVMVPALGIPLTAAAVAVAWARFQLNRHRLSDLYAGLLMGGFFGGVFGLAAQRLSNNSTANGSSSSRKKLFSKSKTRNKS